MRFIPKEGQVENGITQCKEISSEQGYMKGQQEIQHHLTKSGKTL